MKNHCLQLTAPRRSRQRTVYRRGALLVELVVCTILLSVVAAVLVPGIHAVNAQRKATRFETLALIEVNNVAARLSTISDSSAARVSPVFQRRYPDATLTVEAGEPDDVLLQPVTISIRRPHGPSRPDLVRSLTVWLQTDATASQQESNE